MISVYLSFPLLCVSVLSLVGFYLVHKTSLEHLYCVQLKLSYYHGDDAPRTHELCLFKCHRKTIQHVPGTSNT